MKAALLALALLAPAGPRSVVVISYDEPGTYLIEITIDDAGRARVDDLKVDYHLGKPSDPPPDPPVDGELAIRCRDWALAVDGDPDRAGTALALSVVYLEVAKANLSDPFRAIRMATDSVLRMRGASEAWQPWRDKLAAELARLSAAGELNVSQALPQIAAGLRAAGENPEGAIDLAIILEIIRLILELLGER